MSLNARRLGLALAAGVLAACSRPPLPAPTLPLVPTPDEAFRAAPPVLPAELASVRSVPPIQSARLSNGMSVWVATRQRSPYLVMSVVARDAGTWDAAVPAELIDLTTRAIVEGGTVWRDGRVVDPPVLNGRTVEAWTEPTYSELRLSMLKSALDSGFEILTSTLRSPAFDHGSLDRVRVAQLKDIQNASATIGSGLFEVAVTAAYGKATADQLLASRMDEVLRPDTTAVERCYHERFRPETSALIAVGDVTLEEIRALAEPRLGTWQAPGQRAAQVVLERPPLKSSGRRLHFMPGDQNQAEVLVLQPAPSDRESDDELPFALMAEIAAGSPFASRANVSLRHAAGVTYGVHPWTISAGRLGLMGVEASFEVDETEGAIAELFSMLERLQLGEVSADELEQSKVARAAYLERQAQNNASFAELMARVFAAGRAPEWLSTLPGAIAAVNPSDILRVARKYLQPRNVEVAVAGPARLGEELMSLGELQIYTVQRR